MSKNINGGRVKISYFNFVTYLFLNHAQSENVGTPELRLRMSVY